MIFGTNGLDWSRYLMEFDKLGVAEDRAEAILWGNARRVHAL